MPADPSSVSPSEREVEAVEFDEQAITDILVGIDEVLESHGRQRMDIIDGPTVDALRDVVKRELVAFLDRVRDARGDDEAEVWRSMLDRIRIHGASGLWDGEDCAIGAVAALEGGDAGRAFMLEREAARSPQDEDPVEDEVERLRAINAELVEAYNTLLVEAGRSPQGEDHEGRVCPECGPLGEWNACPHDVQDEDHEAKP